MKILFPISRKSKALFIRYKLHVIFGPFANAFLTIGNLTKLSQWINKTSMPAFNDFYAKKRDYEKRYFLYQHIIESEHLDEIYYLEFGVAKGPSFRWWAEHIRNENSRFVGFDTFSGLPEKWGFFKKGNMSANNSVPELNDPRCEFKKGLFKETLPEFLKHFHSEQRKVIHMDADMYTSTLYVLTMLSSFFKKGDILVFDEFNVPLHEFRAFSDFINSYYIQTEVIGAVNNYYQIAFKIV